MACDADIRRGAEAVLAEALGEDAGRVRATVDEGVLTLEGEVTSRLQKAWAEQAAGGLAGVRAVRSLITVASPVRLGEVRRRIRAAFVRDAAARGYHVHVAIDGDLVILRGHVTSWAERQAAERAAAATAGVLDVRNELLVEPWPFAPVIVA